MESKETYVSRLKIGQYVDYNGKKVIVESIHKWFVKFHVVDTGNTICANLGDLVMAGLESPMVMQLHNKTVGVY